MIIRSIETTRCALSLLHLSTVDDVWIRLYGRWSSGQRRSKWKFTIALPADLKDAQVLMKKCIWLLETDIRQMDQNERATILALLVSLQNIVGYPALPVTIPLDITEAGLRKALEEDFTDLASWAAYADFLQDVGHPLGHRIAEWLKGF